MVYFVFTDVSFCGSEASGRDVVAAAASLPFVDYGILSFFF